MINDEHSEIEELKGLKQSISNAMSSVSEISAFQKEILSKSTLDSIYQVALERTLRIVNCKYTALFIFNTEEFSFDLVSELPNYNSTASADYEYFQGDGSIGWCLNNDKIVSVSHEENGHDYLLSALSTDSNIKGLFIAQLEGEFAKLSQIEVQLLEIVLANTALAIHNRELQNDLKQINETLEDKVEERTETLQKALKAAHSASQAKSDFLAVMSHEIRTPLNGVLGMAEHLMDTELASDQRHFTETIIESGKGLLNIINDVLDFSKIEAGKLELDKRAFSLKTTVENVCDIMAKKATEKELLLIPSFDLNIPAILIGDDHRLKQVLLNFVSNALKFTETGYIQIKIKLICHDPEENDIALHFAITDTGIGIPEDRQGKLFQSFTQVDSSTSRQYGGTGLGLAISKEIVNMMDGEVGLESQVGVGTTFSFTLSLKTDFKQTQSFKEYYNIDKDKLKVYLAFKNLVFEETVSKYLEAYSIEYEVRDLNCCDLNNVDGKIILLDSYHYDVYGDKLSALKDKGCQIHLFKTFGHNSESKIAVDYESYLPLKVDDVFKGFLKGNNDISKRPANAGLKFNGERVLLVDDDRTNQTVASLRLRKMNLNVDIADGGHTAIELFQNNEYNLVFMDCQMPDMDGYETTTLIREFESKHRNHMTPIVALTANATKRDRDRCFAVGMNDYLSKPIKTEDIQLVLQEYLSNQQKLAEALLRTSMNFAIATESDKEGVLSVDLSVIRELLDGVDVETEKSLLEIFISDSKERVALLKDELEKENYSEAKKIAHSMKGGAANIGVIPFMEICGRIEEGTLSDGIGLKIHSKLEKELGKVEKFFQENYPD